MARQIIKLGTADKGNGDPIRTAFGKINSNFQELYTLLSGGAGAQIIETDIKGSVFGDDSTMIVDGVNGVLHGRLVGDVEGSVFADDSTKIIDGILGKVVGPIQTNVTNVSILGGANGQVLSTNGSGVLSWTTMSGGTTLTFQPVPTWKYGQAGDVAGMVSADSNYFYVCFRNFIDNSNACWHRIAKDGSW